MSSELKSRGERARVSLFVVTGIVLFGVGVASAADVTPIATNKEGLMTFPNVRVVNAPQLAAPTAATPSGFKAYIDPATGMLRDPTNEELSQESAAASQLLGLSVGPTFWITDSGALAATLDESTMMFSVVQRAEDGGLKEFCVVGPERAAKLVNSKGPWAGAVTRKESRNDR